MVIETNEITKEVIEVYPARCRYNGFAHGDESSFLKLRKFMAEDEHLWELNKNSE